MRANYKMQRLFVRDDLAAGAEFQADPQQSHYLANVLRLGEGAELLVFKAGDHPAHAGQDHDGTHARQCGGGG